MTDGEADKVARLRELLPATGAGIYLDTAAMGPLPAETAAAMRDADEWELRVGRATEGRTEDYDQRVEEARTVLAALLVSDQSEIVLTPGVAHALTLAEQVAPSNRLVVLPQVDPKTGALLTAADIASARNDGAWVAVDASLSAGAIALEAAGLGVDFVALAGDRWLLGPEQTGALWLGPRTRDAGRPVPAPASGLSRTAVLGLARSVGWLEMYVGLELIFGRTRTLAERLHRSLGEAGADVITPGACHAGLIVFRVPGWSASEAADQLRRRVFAIIGSPADGDTLHASVAWFNTPSEIDRFVGAVGELAAHSPTTLPRRPRLELL